MTYDEQLNLWCQGISTHNHETNECCPDFSCCRPSLAIPIEQRILFRDHPEHRMAMLGMFLGALIAEITDKKIHLAGEAEELIH